MSGHLADIRDLSYSYRQGDREQRVLKGVSLHLSEGEVLALTGPSGSGKSTLLTILGGLRGASEGSVSTLGVELIGASERQRVQVRRKIGFVFQHHNLAPALTVAQNIQLGLQHSGLHRDRRAADLINAAAERVGIADQLAKLPAQLSGGQQQRVGVARALVHEPKLVLADEPTASLDKVSGEMVLTLLHQLADEGSAVALVTHDQRIMERAHRIVMLEDGRIVPPKDRLLKNASATMRTLMHLDSKRLGRMLGFGHALARVAMADGRADEMEREAMVRALEAHEVFEGPEVELVVELALGQVSAGALSGEASKLEAALEAVAEADSVVTDEERAVIDELIHKTGA